MTGGNPKTADSLSFVVSFVGKRRRSRIESTKFATKLTTKLGEFEFLSASNLFEEALIRRLVPQLRMNNRMTKIRMTWHGPELLRLRDL